MGRMYLMCGISGSGKTTFAKELCKKFPDLKHLDIDDFYCQYTFLTGNGNPWSYPDASFNVWIKFFEAIHKAEQNGENVLIDTNAPTRVKRLQFIDWFPTFQEHNLIYIQADMKLCLENNKNRGRVIPQSVMDEMLYEFEPPALINSTINKTFYQAEPYWDNMYVISNEGNNFVERQKSS